MDAKVDARPPESTRKDPIRNLMSGFSVETTPVSAGKIPDFREILRPGTTIYITFLPGTDYRDTVGVARRLRNEGFEPAPHFAARAIRNVSELDDFANRVAGEAGVTRVLAIAGAAAQPVGEYADSMQLLQSGVFDRHGIKTIGVAGHPEGSPDISDEAIEDALRWKNRFADSTDASVHILTQFCFEAEPVISWEKKLNAAGNTLPIQVGVPGVARLKTLLNYAVACGIGNSMQFIKKQASNVSRLLRTQTPDKLILDLAHHVESNPGSGICGVHMYPLGGLARSAAWSYAMTDGRFQRTAGGELTTDADLK